MSEVAAKPQPPAVDSHSTDIDQRIADLTKLVGQRVREMRKGSGLSRRELSERSGVSQRYIAQVESGAGNISIALLLKMGAALDCPVDWFLADNDPLSAEASQVATLYRKAESARRHAVMRMLKASEAGPGRANRVALIGLRGAGKSTLGRRAAAKLSARFAELNDEIESDAGMTVADVMALYGQEGYRALENRALSRVVETNETVILAVAGGIVSAPDTFEVLLNRFHTIWLKAAPQDHMDRVRAQGDERPMAGNPLAIDELKAILSGREAQYARADCVLDTSGRSENAVLDDLLATLKQRGFLE